MHVSISKLALLGLSFAICTVAHAQVTDRLMLYAYAQRGDFLAIRAMLSQGVSLELKDDYGLTAVCEAVARQDQYTLDVLVSFGANPYPSCLNRLDRNLVMAMRPQPMIGHLSREFPGEIMIPRTNDDNLAPNADYVPEVYASTGGGSKVGRFFRWVF